MRALHEGTNDTTWTSDDADFARAFPRVLRITGKHHAAVELDAPECQLWGVGGLRAYYEHDRVTVPDGPGLGVEPEEAVLKRYAVERDWITV